MQYETWNLKEEQEKHEKLSNAVVPV